MRRSNLALLALVAACRSGGTFETPEVTPPPAWSTASEAAAIDEAWWHSFGDPLLVSLVERMLANNLELAQADARLGAARALLAVVAGQGGPRGDFRAVAERREPSTAVAGGEFLPTDDAAFYSAGLDLSWELDLFGRRARAVEAAQADLDAQQEETRAVALALVAEVGRQYVEWRVLEAEIELFAQASARAAQVVTLIGARVAAGFDDERTLLDARARQEELLARLAPLSAERAARVHALALLLGLWPGELEAELAPAARPLEALLVPPERIESGLPLDLLRRRPDLRAAERRVAEAWARGREAEAALYPVLSLGAALGLESEALADLASQPARALRVGPSLTAPLFHGGALRWAVRARDAEEEAARSDYERAVQNAVGEVEDALARFERGRARRAALALARQSAQERAALVGARAEAGLESELGSLAVELARVEADLAWVRGEGEQVLAAVRLYRALGGGFGPAPEPQP